MAGTPPPRGPGDPTWYRDAVIYELHVRAFQDSNADGIGDFPGLTARLPYLQDLGVTALWLLPFYPSPLRDDGYDIAEYTGVHPDYGTLDDFRRFSDFDGEPTRPLYERRLKRSPLFDVACMVRSYHFAAHRAVARARRRLGLGGPALARVTAYARAWRRRVSEIFVGSCAQAMAGSGLLPADPETTRLLFRSYLVERAFYELGFELAHRSEWLWIPVEDLPELLASGV
jgi:hypothetical protein